jgi:hypothetical protein
VLADFVGEYINDSYIVRPGFAVPRHIWVGGYGVSD